MTPSPEKDLRQTQNLPGKTKHQLSQHCGGGAEKLPFYQQELGEKGSQLLETQKSKKFSSFLGFVSHSLVSGD